MALTHGRTRVLRKPSLGCYATDHGLTTDMTREIFVVWFTDAFIGLKITFLPQPRRTFLKEFLIFFLVERLHSAYQNYA